MYVCNRCGLLKDERNMRVVVEPHGETHENHICRCGGEFVEATKCKICGHYFDNTELFGVCEGCISEEETVGNALEVGDLNRVDAKVNGFIANVLTENQINKILGKWVEEHFTDHSKAVVEYLENDKGYFSEFLDDKYKE